MHMDLVSWAIVRWIAEPCSSMGLTIWSWYNINMKIEYVIWTGVESSHQSMCPGEFLIWYKEPWRRICWIVKAQPGWPSAGPVDSLWIGFLKLKIEVGLLISFVKYPGPYYFEVQVSTHISIIYENHHNNFNCNYNLSNPSVFRSISREHCHWKIKWKPALSCCFSWELWNIKRMLWEWNPFSIIYLLETYNYQSGIFSTIQFLLECVYVLYL